MAKFKLCAAVTVSCWTEVEADTLEEAIEKAEKRNLAHLPSEPILRSSR